MCKVSKAAKIRNRYSQVPHLTQDTNGKVTNSQLDTTKESQEVSPFPAGDHKAHMSCFVTLEAIMHDSSVSDGAKPAYYQFGGSKADMSGYYCTSQCLRHGMQPILLHV